MPSYDSPEFLPITDLSEITLDIALETLEFLARLELGLDRNLSRREIYEVIVGSYDFPTSPIKPERDIVNKIGRAANSDLGNVKPKTLQEKLEVYKTRRSELNLL
jgi:hypothetical protein